MNIPTLKELFVQIKINFWLVGIYFDSSNIALRYYVCLLALVLMLIEEISFFVSKISSENFLVLVDLAPCIVIGFNSMIKFTCVTFKRKQIRRLVSSLEVLYEEILQSEKKISIVKKSNVVLKSLLKYYFILNAILISIYNFSTLIIIPYHYHKSNELVYQLPYPILIPFSTDSWPTWLLIYLHSIACGFICVLYYTTVDALYCILTSQVCGNFEVLCDEIVSLDKTNSNQLTAIINRHQHILKLSEDLEDIFTAPNFYNVLVGSLNICVLGFNLTTGDISRAPGFLLFLISVLLQILMMSVFGDNLIEESAKVADAAFCCKWYEMDERSKKIVLIIIMRSNKPQRLTAYKFSTIGYGSFTKIISTSWSYFTILRTVYKPSEN